MASIIESFVQIDVAASRHPPQAEVIEQLLRNICTGLCTPEGGQELDDVIFDALPTLARVAGLSKACGEASRAAIAETVTRCPPREMFTALAAALTTPTADEDEPAAAIELQSFLLQQLARTLRRIQRRWIRFLEEHLSVAVQWCCGALGGDSSPPAQAAALRGFIDSLEIAVEAALAESNGTTLEERERGSALICCAALEVAGAALEAAANLAQADAAVAKALPEAQATLSGKTMRFQGALEGLVSGAEATLSKLAPLGVHSLDALAATCAHAEGSGGPADPGVGLGAAVCCALFKSSTPMSVPSEISLCCPAPAGRTLALLSPAVNSLTDAAARHKSVPLALLPLLAVQHFSRQLAANPFGPVQLEEGHMAAALPVMSTLVDVMSHNPVEIVRNCAYEALMVLTDAMTPPARMEALQQMMQMPSTAAATVALQRLRLEISPAIPDPPFSQQAVLLLAEPWLRHGHHPGWSTEAQVLQHVDVMAAALSVVRFALLQRAAGGAACPATAPARLAAMLEKDLLPLKACISRLIGRLRQKQGAASGGLAQLEAVLAVDRLEDMLERTIEMATQLSKGG